MKLCSNFTLAVVCCAFLAASGFAQTLESATSREGAAPRTKQFFLKDRGPHHRTWSKITEQKDASGRVTLATNLAYVELAAGLHYLEAGQWQESRAEFELSPQGYAVARFGRHQAVISPVLNDVNGAVDLQTPTGGRMRSTILGLALRDRLTGTNLLVAQIKSGVVGRQSATNEIIFEDCFDNLHADVRYVFERGGFHQDVILREALDAVWLEQLGFNPKTTRLEIWTEFLESPAPRIQQRVLSGIADPALRVRVAEPDVVDDELEFGDLRIPIGRAYARRGSGAAESSVEVPKRWLRIDGRTFLIESISLHELNPMLAGLPTRRPPEGISGETMYAGRRPPTPSLITPGTNVILTASVDRPTDSGGVVLDYQLVTGVTDFTFRGDTTYYVSGDVWIYNVTLEGGAVIKYEPGVGRLNSSGSVTCKTDPYRPAVFTSKNDNTVGEIIAGSTGVPSTSEYNSMALRLYYMADARLRHLRFSHVGVGVLNYFGAVELRDSQFVKCRYPIDAYEAVSMTLRNVLMSDVPGDAISLTRSFASAEHLTFNQGYKLVNGLDSSFAITNSLLTGVQWWGSVPSVTNQVVRLTSATGVFQSVGAGYHYLATNSLYRNAGTTNINTALLASLKAKTTCPPLVYSNVTYTSDVILAPQAARDTDTPDLGFHYDPIDYITDNVIITNASLTLTNGVIVACYNNGGLALWSGTGLNSVGTATAPNWFTRYNCVQEQPVKIGIGQGSSVYAYQSPTLTANFRFSKFSAMANSGGYHLYNAMSHRITNMFVRDCEFYGNSSIYLIGQTNTGTRFVNNLLFRTFFHATSSGGTDWLGFSNNLAFGTTLRFGSGASSNLWAIYNNAFDQCLFAPIATNQITMNGYNAYINSTNRLNPLHPSDQVLTNFNYQSGPLGAFYQPTTSALRDVGSVSNAALAGFHYYTTTTNQVWEASSVLDIGYHYVAVNTATGLPIDSDWDGIPDYEDADSDNDGLPDAWEIVRFSNLNQNASGDGDFDELTNLQEYQLGTSPTYWDTDGDGLSDSEELTIPVEINSPELGMLDPLVPDTADTGIPDGDKDSDRDAISNLGELRDYLSEPADPHTFTAYRDDSEYLFSAKAGDAPSISYGVLSNPSDAGPGLLSLTVSSYAGAKYDLYFVNKLLPSRWEWRRFSTFTCDSAGQATIIVAQPDPQMGNFMVLDANDTDNDGLSDGYESWFTYNGRKTLVNRADSDFDTMTDPWEVGYGLDPTDSATGSGTISGGGSNPDGDGYSNLSEFSANQVFAAPTYDPRKRLSVEPSRPVVSITSPDSAAGGPYGTATFTLTRSIGGGATLSGDMVVYYSVGGDAAYGTDYSLNPAPAETPRIWSATIPDGQASVTVTLNPITVGLNGFQPRKVEIKLVPYGVAVEPRVSDPLQWLYVVNLFKQAVTLNIYNQLPGLNGPVYAVKMYETVVYGPNGQCSEFHQLIVGGQFTMAGTTPVNNIARLNTGTGLWEAMGAGVNGPIYSIEAVERFPGDGSPDIYVGGNFTSPARAVAKWNGSSSTWSMMGSGLNSSAFQETGLCKVHAVRKVGSDIWVGGRFSSAGGVASPNLAKWNMTSSQWQPLGGAIISCSGQTDSQLGLNDPLIMVTAIDRNGTAIGVSRNGISCAWCPVTIVSGEAYYSVENSGTLLRGRCRSAITAGINAVLGNLAGSEQIVAQTWSPASYETALGNYSGLGQLYGTEWRMLGSDGYALPPAGSPWWPASPSPNYSGWKTLGAVNSIVEYGGDTFIGGSFNTLAGAYATTPLSQYADYSPMNNIFTWNAGSGWKKLQNIGGVDCVSSGALGLNGEVHAMDVEYSLCTGQFQGIWVGGNFSKAGGGSAWNIAFWSNQGNGTGYWRVPPTPTITSPANGSVVLPAATVTLSASFPGGCGIAGVEFYDGSLRLAVVANSPYEFTWNNVSVGTHSLTAVSTDITGRVGVSDVVTFRVDAPPTVSIASPANGSTFVASANVTVTTSASDSDGTVSNVKFYANGALIGTDTTAPYSVTWAGTAAGSYSLMATATDNDGAVTSSSSITVQRN